MPKDDDAILPQRSRHRAWNLPAEAHVRLEVFTLRTMLQAGYNAYHREKYSRKKM
jgi:hypothetical protein